MAPPKIQGAPSFLLFLSFCRVSGYLPKGSEAYRMADEKTKLPGAGEAWYCPRETLELVMQWEAGTLSK